MNAAAINDSNEIWSWYGDATMVFQADGAVALGLTASADASVVLLADLSPQLRLITAGTADMVVLADAEALYGRAATGDALMQLAADGAGARWTFGASDLNAVFQVDGDAQVVAQVSVSFNIQFDAELDGRAATVQQGMADLSLVLNAQAEYRVAKAIYLEGDAPVLFGIEAMPWLQINSPSGFAEISWQAAGDSRLGGVLYGEGSADLAWIATGDAGQWHYHFAEGDADLQITVVAERHGLPTLPTTFIAAPPVRSLALGAERRAFTVPAERRA